jgi:dephospho-CoA kinase
MQKPCLILLGGAPGVGKSTVANLLNLHLSPSVWLDGDDLWRMHPFSVTTRTKEMVLRNIRYLLASFLSESFDYILFSWVMHEPWIVRQIMRDIDPAGHILLHVTLICSDQTLLKRISGDSVKRDPLCAG